MASTTGPKSALVFPIRVYNLSNDVNIVAIDRKLGKLLPFRPWERVGGMTSLWHSIVTIWEPLPGREFVHRSEIASCSFQNEMILWTYVHFPDYPHIK